MYQQREGHILVLLECPETEASAGPLSSPIMDLLRVLGWAVTGPWAWVPVELSRSDLHGPVSGSHMPWVAAHIAVTVGWKSIPDHGPDHGPPWVLPTGEGCLVDTAVAGVWT